MALSNTDFQLLGMTFEQFLGYGRLSKARQKEFEKKARPRLTHARTKAAKRGTLSGSGRTMHETRAKEARVNKARAASKRKYAEEKRRMKTALKELGGAVRGNELAMALVASRTVSDSIMNLKALRRKHFDQYTERL